MPPPRLHTRIIQHPFAPSLQGALLDCCAREQDRLTLGIHALDQDGPPQLIQQAGTLLERVRGKYIPIRLTFSGVNELQGASFLETLPDLPPVGPKRTINALLSWRQPEREDVFYLFDMRFAESDPRFFARRVSWERVPGPTRPADFERDWSPAPPMPDRLVPRPVHLHRRFGGDPITLTLNGQPRTRRLFVGGLDCQFLRRPGVEAVLNLGEQASRWTDLEPSPPSDRWAHMGEGRAGMTVDEMRAEAGWVIERLQQGQRVLVHCVAGMNRSVTICCAVLILLEGLSAGAALERVRQHHPWARPDSGHWLKLKWLAAMNPPRKS